MSTIARPLRSRTKKETRMNFRILPIAGIASVAGLLSIALGGSAIAGGGGFPPTPGTYRSTDTAAYADLLGPPSTVCVPVKGCGPGPSDEAFVSVDRGLLTFKPKTGPRLIQQNGTMLTLFAFAVNGSSVYGCWIIPDGDFIVSSGLSSASLSTTVPAQSNCPGAPVAISAANGVSGKGSGGGGGTGAPISLNVSWSYRGVVSHFTDVARQVCGGFETRGNFESSAATATAQGQVSIVTETMTSNFASIQSSATDQLVKGVPPDACF
jgi:hypothetical protein